MITLILWICASVAIAVSAVMIYSIASFRRAQGIDSKAMLHKTLSEVLWAMIPVMILFGTAVPAVKTLVASKDENRPAPADGREAVRQAAVWNSR